MADFPDAGLVQGEEGKHSQQELCKIDPESHTPLLGVLSHHFQDHTYWRGAKKRPGASNKLHLIFLTQSGGSVLTNQLQLIKTTTHRPIILIWGMAQGLVDWHEGKMRRRCEEKSRLLLMSSSAVPSHTFGKGSVLSGRMRDGLYISML